MTTRTILRMEAGAVVEAGGEAGEAATQVVVEVPGAVMEDRVLLSGLL